MKTQLPVVNPTNFSIVSLNPLLVFYEGKIYIYISFRDSGYVSYSEIPTDSFTTTFSIHPLSGSFAKGTTFCKYR